MQHRDGCVSVLDDPFAEAKERVGGVFLIDVPTREAALAIAARVPSRRFLRHCATPRRRGDLR
ncbi:MAG: YciI family protein [Burkholderiales bacterium]|nr:YciI family protein [Burkholderiales bacterium]